MKERTQFLLSGLGLREIGFGFRGGAAFGLEEFEGPQGAEFGGILAGNELGAGMETGLRESLEALPWTEDGPEDF